MPEWDLQLFERTLVSLEEDFLGEKLATSMLLSKQRASDQVPEGISFVLCMQF